MAKAPKIPCTVTLRTILSTGGGVVRKLVVPWWITDKFAEHCEIDGWDFYRVNSCYLRPFSTPQEAWEGAMRSANDRYQGRMPLESPYIQEAALSLINDPDWWRLEVGEANRSLSRDSDDDPIIRDGIYSTKPPIEVTGSPSPSGSSGGSSG